MKRYRRMIGFLLILILTFSMGASCRADSDHCRAVIGADLTQEQVNEVYRLFGVDRGYAKELLITNAEERALLQGVVPDLLLGTRAISCVFVEIYPPGGGISVSTCNINWCTPEMVMTALATAGITDARVIVAAPFESPGTAALTGIYKAYEDITGQDIDGTAKNVGTQELTLTGELAEQIGNEDSMAIVNELKLILDETKNMSEEELLKQIDTIADSYKVRLSDSQKAKLAQLYRSLEKLDIGSLKERVDGIQDTLQKLSESKDKVLTFFDKVKAFIESVRDFFERVSEFIDKVTALFR